MQIHQTLGGTDRFQHCCGHFRNAADAGADEDRIHDEGDELAGGDLAGLLQMHAAPDHQHDRTEHAQDDERDERPAPACAFHREITRGLHTSSVTQRLPGFIGEGLHTLDPLQRFFHDHIRVGDAVLHLFAQFLDEPAEDHCDDRDHGDRDQHGERERGRERSEQHDPDHDDHHLPDEFRKCRSECVLQQGDIGADAAVQFAHAALREKEHRELQQMFVGILAKPREHVLGDVGEDVDPEESDDRLERENTDQQERYRIDVVQIEKIGRFLWRCAFRGIHQAAHERGEHHAEAARDQQEHHADREDPCMLAEVPEQPQEFAQRGLVQLRRLGILIGITSATG